MLKRMVAFAPLFPLFLASNGIMLDDDCNIVGLDSRRAMFRRGGRGGGGGGKGGGGMGGWLAGLILVLFLAYIAMNLISSFAPVMGNLTYSGTGIGATIFSLVQTWILPLGLIGLLLYVVYAFLSHRGR
jgi:hypothetical protein